MNNIFKNAYFGKAYKTRDGRKAIYFCQNKWHELIVENETICLPYQDNGLAVGEHLKDPEWPEDIVSEWTINEEELDKLAKNEIAKMALSNEEITATKLYKAGYRKALE